MLSSWLFASQSPPIKPPKSPRVDSYEDESEARGHVGGKPSWSGLAGQAENEGGHRRFASLGIIRRRQASVQAPTLQAVPGRHLRQSASPVPEIRAPLSGRGSKRWFLGGLLCVVVAVVFLLSYVSSSVFTPAPSLLIEHREFKPVPYRRLNTDGPVSIRRPLNVIHVTKEFGPASMGGLGTVVTSLGLAQASSSIPHEVAVIMPYYSFMRSAPGIEHFAHIAVPIEGLGDVKCEVSMVRWRHSVPDLLDAEPDKAESQTVLIYLIGSGDRAPYSDAFHAIGAHDIYTAYRPLPQERKDQYFSSAAARLIRHLSDQNVLIDALHLHGATNAWTGLHLRALAMEKKSASAPAIVYTLHDYTEEPEYSNEISNVAPFMSSEALLGVLTRHSLSDRVYASSIGIRVADHVTTVSERLASDIIERQMTFPLQELIVPSLLERAKTETFHGISNAMDFLHPARNPFASAALLAHDLAFPNASSYRRRSEDDEDEEAMPSTVGTPLLDTKHRAKEYLVDHAPDVLRDANEPLILFIGRFQYNKGCELFAPLIRYLVERGNGRLVALGTRNNYPHGQLRRLARDHPDRFVLLDDPQDQNPLSIRGEWLGPVLRIAADFVFVPSYAESFGMIAAEGLLFGSQPISTAVGGMAEFLHDRENAHTFQRPFMRGESGQPGESYDFGQRFTVSKEDLQAASERLVAVVDRALDTWIAQSNRLEASELEAGLRRLVQDALEMQWDRSGGPVEQAMQHAKMRAEHPSLEEADVPQAKPRPRFVLMDLVQSRRAKVKSKKRPSK